jgi:hypothetical protein
MDPAQYRTNYAITSICARRRAVATSRRGGAAAACERMRVGPSPMRLVACRRRRSAVREALVIRSSILCSLLFTACAVDLDPDLDRDGTSEHSAAILDIAPHDRRVVPGAGLQLLECCTSMRSIPASASPAT